MKNTIYIHNSLNIDDYTNSDGSFVVNGYAAHFTTPNLNGEIVDARSFSNSIADFDKGLQNVVLNYNHNQEKIIGGVDSLKSDDKGLYISAHLNTNIPYVNEYVIPNIVSKDLRSFSTEGYVSYDDVIANQDGTYYVSNFMLYAVAIVSNPADQLASFSIANAFKANAAVTVLKPKYYLYW